MDMRGNQCINCAVEIKGTNGFQGVSVKFIIVSTRLLQSQYASVDFHDIDVGYLLDGSRPLFKLWLSYFVRPVNTVVERSTGCFFFLETLGAHPFIAVVDSAVADIKPMNHAISVEPVVSVRASRLPTLVGSGSKKHALKFRRHSTFYAKFIGDDFVGEGLANTL